MDDAQLLQQYADEGSEAAFQTLVRRHLGLVHGTALRQVGDPSLAQDVSQAVFLLLAQKAGRLGSGVVVSGWLYRTTIFVASRVRRSELRRRRREQEALDMSELQSTDEVWKRLSPELDEALSRLGETDRNVLLLRFGSGHSHREVGEVLGLSEEAVRKRAQRALGALRDLLMRAGVTVSVGVLSTLLVERINAQPPAGLETGILIRVRDGGAAPGPLGDIVRDTLAGWRAAWIPWAATVGMAVLVLFGVATLPSRLGRSEPAGIAPSVAATIPNAPGNAVPSGAAPASPGAVLRLKVISAADGTPLSGVPVVAQWVVGRDWTSRDDLVTAADGVCEIPILDSGLARLDAGAHAPGWSGRFFTWITNWQEPLPEGYLLELQPGRTVGGQVRNARQEPVPDVAVWLDEVVGDTSWREPREDRERAGLPIRVRVATTDRNGRWTCSEISGDRNRFRLQFEHPAFAKADVSVSQPDPAQPSQVLLRLLAREHVTTLSPGTVASGSVVDESGNPIADARIAPSWSEPGVQSGIDGTFAMTRLPRGPITLVATAAGFAPQEFIANAGGAAVLVRMKPGGVIRARIVDAAGTPIPGATLGFDGGYGLGAVGWDSRTDHEGRVEWTGAPKGTPLQFFASADGFALSRGISLPADGAEHSVVLLPVPVVRGRVVDAVTRVGVPSFKALPATGWEPFDRSGLRYGTQGNYDLRFPEGGVSAVLIEAEGYESAVGEPREVNGILRCDFELKPLAHSGPIRGVVQTPAGEPVSGLDVVLLTLEWSASLLESGRLKVEPEGPVYRTDSEGRFELPRNSRAHSVVVSGPEGFARNRIRDFGTELEVTLQPWGRIEVEGAPAKAVLVLSDVVGADWARGISLHWLVRFTSEGSAVVDRVPAGAYVVQDQRGRGLPTLVRVQFGETSQVRLESGRPVIGRIVAAPGEAPLIGGPAILVGRLGSRVSPGQTPSSRPVRELAEWHRRAEFWESPEVQEALMAPVLVPVAVSPDGSFRAEGVPPGSYGLTVDVRRNSAGEPAVARQYVADVEIPVLEADGNPLYDAGVVLMRGLETRLRRAK